MLAARHPLAIFDGDAAAFQMAVLRRPAIAVVEAHAVAAVLAFEVAVTAVEDIAINHFITHAGHGTWRRCQYRHPVGDLSLAAQADIGAGMLVGGHRATGVIAAPGDWSGRRICGSSNRPQRCNQPARKGAARRF